MIHGETKPTGYRGIYDGQEIKSLYPNVYRIQCEAYFSGRIRPVDTIITARDDIDARSRAMKRYQDIRRAYDGSWLTVKCVATLDPNT